LNGDRAPQLKAGVILLVMVLTFTPKVLANCSPGQRPGKNAARIVRAHAEGVRAFGFDTLSGFEGKCFVDSFPGRCLGLKLANAFGV